MIVNREAFYVWQTNLYYVSFDEKGTVNHFSLYSEVSNYSKTKEYMVEQNVVQGKYEKALEMIYIYKERNGFEFVCIADGKLKYFNSKDSEGLVFLYDTRDRYYDKLFKNRIGKYLKEINQPSAGEFWKIMALKSNDYSIEEALGYIDKHSVEFYVEKFLC